MKLKTAKLTGLPLSWALALADGRKPSFVLSEGKLHHIQSELIGGGGWESSYDYSNPRICMGLIEKQKINVKHICHLATKRAVLASWGSLVADNGYMQEFGSTPAEAVARCVVAMRLGDEVEVPDELVGVQS
jgi:hypothetical protein